MFLSVWISWLRRSATQHLIIAKYTYHRIKKKMHCQLVAKARDTSSVNNSQTKSVIQRTLDRAKWLSSGQIYNICLFAQSHICALCWWSMCVCVCVFVIKPLICRGGIRAERLRVSILIRYDIKIIKSFISITILNQSPFRPADN